MAPTSSCGHENNLIGSRHIRYGGYGGIAYHHIADTYIALFTSFSSCGGWEGVYMVDGLMKHRSAIQPDPLHADTPGSERTGLRSLQTACSIKSDAAHARLSSDAALLSLRPNPSATSILMRCLVVRSTGI